MSIDLGKIIESKAKLKRLSQRQLGDKINTTKQNVGDIYKRKSVDSQLLVKLCEALDYNFFEELYAEEPLKSMRSRDTEKIQKMIETLQEEINALKRELEDKMRLIESQDDRIGMLKEREAQYMLQKNKDKEDDQP